MTDDFETRINAARAAIGKPPVGKHSDIPRFTPLWAWWRVPVYRSR